MRPHSIFLVPVTPSLLPSTSTIGGLTSAPLASQPVVTVTPTLPVDCGTQNPGLTSIKCLHEYARRVGRYPKLGLFTADTEEIVSPPNPPDELEDTEDDDDDGEYLPTRQTTRLSRPASPARASSSRMSSELPPKTRRRKRGESPDGNENAKRRKGDTGDPSATPRPTTQEIEADPKTGRQFMVVRDKRGKVLNYRCPDHPDVNCSSRGDMGRHLQSRDHQQPSFCCVETCGRKFTRIDALKRHVDNANLHPKRSLVVVEHETGAETYLAREGKRQTKRM